jgi:hypothetical protein
LSEVFRMDTLCTKILKAYFQKVSVQHKYFQNCFLPAMQEICSMSGSFEVDPQKEMDAGLRKSNFKRLSKCIDLLLAAIFQSLSSLPTEIRSVCHYIKQTLNELDKGLNCDILIGAILFLRFICPAIVKPQSIGISSVSPEVQRGLILSAKLIQNLSNNIEFGDKEAYMIDLNVIIAQYREKFAQFLVDVPSPPPLMLASGNAISIPFSSREKLEATAKVLYIVKKKIRPSDFEQQHIFSGLMDKIFDQF